MKRKVNLNRTEISSQEIEKHKDFNSVLKNQATLTKPFFKKNWFFSTVSIASVAIVSLLILVNNNSSKKNVSINENKTFLIKKDSLELLAFYQKEEAKSCIHPPLDGVNIPYTIFKVNSESESIINVFSGSKLTVPENAFINKNGDRINGEIELHYREFHDAVDFFVSGIPMTYDSAGVKYQFESAGMMEILAYQNGEQVCIAKNKSINVELASSYSGKEYNLYKLDTLNHNWACLGKDKVLNNGKIIDKNESNLEVSVIQQSPQYKTLETKKILINQEKETQIEKLIKPVFDLKKPLLSNKEKYTFPIEVDPKEYPELAVFKGVLFEVGDENKNFTKAMYNITWDDAIIKAGTKKGENYLLTLKKASKKYDFIVYPVYDKKNYDPAMKQYNDKFYEYNIALEKRKADEKRIDDEYQAKLNTLKNQQLEMERKWKMEAEKQYSGLSTEQKVVRAFVINSFGVYNSDCPKNYPKGVICSANLTAEKSAKLQCYEIYLVDRSRNGLFTFYKNPIAKFSFNPKSTNLLWTVENGVLYWLNSAQFNSISSNGGMVNLKMKKVEQKFKTADEIKLFFNI